MFKKITAWAIILCVLFAVTFTSCREEQKVFDYDSGQNSVTLSITGIDGDVIIKDAEMSFAEGATVFDCTRFILDKEKITYDYSGIGGSVYVKGINQLYEKDNGALSGWLYRINGSFETAGESSGKVKVEHGDFIEWLYSKDGGEDVGAKIS